MWRQGVDELRRRTQAELPELLASRWMPPLGRFLETAYRIGGALVGWRLKERSQGGAASRAGLSQRLRKAAEPLGPAYIKLGKILSSGT